MNAPPAAPRPAGAGDRRDDIQGMRALAVMMVVAYHAGVPLPGGFTGPDVFFVVSGFVIAGMLLREQRATGRIALGRFYLRRARRLLPAMAVATIATLVLAVIVFSPLGSDQQVTGLAAYAEATIRANLYFLQQTGGYFQPLAQKNPLLHTWTLSVEEQFYFALPVTLFALWWAERRWGGGRRSVTVLLSLGGLASLSACVLLSYGHVPPLWVHFANHIGSIDPLRVAFFYPVTRAWEFLAGVILALSAERWAPGPILGGAAAVVGIALLVLTNAMLHATDVFPGALVMMPVVAAVGLLVGGLGSPAPVVTRLLSVKPMVWIGDRSYSWYLWHWPLIVYARVLFPTSSSAVPAAAAISLVPAMLSFAWVEEPIRRRRIWPSTTGGVFVAATSIAVTVACALVVTAEVDRGWGDPNLVHLRQAAEPDHVDITAVCASMTPLGGPGRAPCVWPAAASHGTMLLIGDSNAGHFSEPFIAAAAALHYDAQVATAGGCPLLRRLTYPSEICRHFVEGSLAAIARRAPAYSGIIISNATLGYLDGPAPLPFADAPPGTSVTRVSIIAGWVASVRRTVEALGHRSPIVVVGAVPQFDAVPECLRPTLFEGPSGDCGVRTAAWAASRRTDIVTNERAAVLSLGATYFDAGAKLCPAGQGCSAFLNGRCLYRDAGHLSVEGGMTFEPDFEAALANVLTRDPVSPARR